MKAFASSATPNSDLAKLYIGEWALRASNIGAALSTFACALASANGAARVVFSLSRDARIPTRYSGVHPVHESPHKALTISMIIGLICGLAFIPFTDSPSNVYGWLGALATLAVIIAYGMTSLASIIFFWKEDAAKRHYFQVIPVVVGIFLLGFTFKAQILPIPPSPLNYWPYVVLVYMLFGGMILYSQRGLRIAKSAANDSLNDSENE